MSIEASSPYAGKRVVVMGLGLHGGGLESARFLAKRGAEVLVTDLRDEKVLAPSIEKLSDLDLRYVLGRHDMADFEKADIVVKNPGVKPDSPYLAASKRIETDLSIFLSECPARVVAVTGSKGKSSTSSALRWGFERAGRRVFLGGNITVSPLTFLDELRPEDEVVLELSSWQLGDLKGRLDYRGKALCKPRVAVMTAIMPDHLDRYGTMDAYIADKRIIYQGQDGEDATVCPADEWGRSFASETRGRVFFYGDAEPGAGADGAWVDPEGRGLSRRDGSVEELVPAAVLTPGRHQKRNLLAAALALRDLGVDAAAVREAMGSFPGIEHRLEFFHEHSGAKYYNDTAATIPDAAKAAVESFERPPVLVAGGSDKSLDFAPLVAGAAKAKAVVLLAGTGSAKLAPRLAEAGVAYLGPFDDLDAAVRAAAGAAEAGDAVVLSPGCASFGMFLNEFDRGRKWKDAVKRLVR